MPAGLFALLEESIMLKQHRVRATARWILSKGCGALLAAAGFAVLPCHASYPQEQTVPGIRPYQGAWWGGATENGWGVSMIERRNTLIVGWHYFDAGGKPAWAIMPGCAFDAAKTMCSGTLQASTTRGPGDHKAASFASRHIGTATFTFIGNDQAVFDYNVDGVSGHKMIMRRDLNTGLDADMDAPVDLAGAWRDSGAGDGRGVVLFQTGGTLIGSWYTCSADGTPAWLQFHGGTWLNATRFRAQLMRSTGSPMFTGSYDATAFRSVEAGELHFEFLDANHAEMSYVIDGVPQYKNIVKMPF
jgi:hypothetical protein